MRMTTAEIARVVGGRVEGPSELAVFGAEVDSRRLKDGDLFVAFPGARRDGHEFVASALVTAAAALVRYDAELPKPPDGRALVRCEDPFEAYHALARHERSLYGWEIVAVTGSVGKTTTKDFLASLLAPHRPTGASRENRNNTLGLPAELLSQDPEIEIFVAEAGMTTPGELSVLGEILRPQVLLYTRIAPAHLEFFPSIEGVVRAKAELLPWLDGDGTLVLNADDPHQKAYAAETSARVVWYGTSSADVWVEDLEDRGLLGTRFRLVSADGAVEITLNVPGSHQAENLLAAATAASVFGVSGEDVALTAPELKAPEHRGRIFDLGDDITLVDDSYNSSPLAVRRLLGLLARAPGRRVAVLGEMYELGEQSSDAHRQAGAEAAAASDLLVAVGGADAAQLVEAAREAGLDDGRIRHVDNADRAVDLLRRELRSGDVVLVKGSRGVGLDRTVAALTREGSA